MARQTGLRLALSDSHIPELEDLRLRVDGGTAIFAVTAERKPSHAEGGFAWCSNLCTVLPEFKPTLQARLSTSSLTSYIPRGSKVVPFWAVYYNPEEENTSQQKRNYFGAGIPNRTDF